MRMQRFWSWMAVNLGRHAGMVAAIGLVFTVALGFGITKLEFATGQDSYLNKNDVVYKDNIAYQELFGGQAMLSVISMRDGAKIDSIFTKEGIATMEKVAQDLRDSGQVLGVISPVTALNFSASLVTSADGNPFNAVAAKALVNAQKSAEAAGDTVSAAARTADLGITTQRLLAVPADQQTLDNPEWVKFLLYDNAGEVRLALRPFFPDDTHAQMITRLPGNGSIESEGA
ncbi:MAG: RND transporter, partial [Actinobacteria bacterium]|nr:RND transporter [Actinomycetota bacterium]